MPNVISKETLLPFFADDSKCFCLIFGRDEGEKLHDDLNQIFQWSCIQVMEFNANECKVLRVAHRRSIIKKDYYLGGTKLDCMDVEKDLGFWLARIWAGIITLISLRKLKECLISFTVRAGT